MPTQLQIEVKQLRDIPGFRMEDFFTALNGHSRFADTTLRNWLYGNQPETPEIAAEVRAALARVRSGLAVIPHDGVSIDAIRAPRKAKVQRSGETYVIDFLRDILAVLDYCWEHSTLGCVIAAFGTGKTYAVEYWRARHRDVPCAVIELHEFITKNRTEMVRAIAEALNLAPAGTGSKIFDQVVEELRRSPRLLIIDQAEGIRVPVAQLLRQIHDRTRDDGTGMVILGANPLFTRLQNSRNQELGALTSRIEPWAVMRGVTAEEVAGIVKKEGIADIDAAAMHELVQKVNGSMRLLSSYLRLLKSEHAGRPVRKGTIEGFAKRLCGIRDKA